MVCESVATGKVTQMCHDNLANALRRVISACSCHSAAKPHYRALAGQGIVACQRRGIFMVVLLQLERAAVDVLAVHVSAKSYADQVARAAGWSAAMCGSFIHCGNS